LLVRTPLLALPFALFFWVQKGAAPRLFIYYFLAAFVFALIIGLANWATEHFVLPRFGEVGAADRPAVAEDRGLHGGASLIGTLIAALILHFTLIPDLLRGPRDIALFAMYTLLFTMLFLGIGMASAFYRRVESRAPRRARAARRPRHPGIVSAHELSCDGGGRGGRSNVPSREVSGDFYDVVPDGEGRFLIAIADVAGKGIRPRCSPRCSRLRCAPRRARSRRCRRSCGTSTRWSIAAPRSSSSRPSSRATRHDDPRAHLLQRGPQLPVILKRDGRIATLERGGTVVGILATRSTRRASSRSSPATGCCSTRTA